MDKIILMTNPNKINNVLVFDLAILTTLLERDPTPLSQDYYVLRARFRANYASDIDIMISISVFFFFFLRIGTLFASKS